MDVVQLMVTNNSVRISTFSIWGSSLCLLGPDFQSAESLSHYDLHFPFSRRIVW